MDGSPEIYFIKLRFIKYMEVSEAKALPSVAAGKFSG